MPQININIKSFEWSYIQNTIKKINEILFFLENTNKKNICLPTKRRLYTVLRSPHIDKKSREQFQFTRYKIQFSSQFHSISNSILFLFLLKNAEFPGVEIQISLLYNSYFYK